MVYSRNNTTNLSNNSSALFEPSVNRSIKEGGSGIAIYETQDGTITNDSSLGISSSFKYDAQGNGIKSTQQLKVDWSDFANHTFFNSAQVKTNVAFQKILNEFPFDGNKQKVELFLDGLTGFERYVYTEFPKNKDYLIFSGTRPGETFGGTYVIAQDAAGAAFPDASIKVTGQSFLDPGYKSMTVEYWCYLSGTANNNEAIVDKHITTSPTDINGFYIGLSSSVSTTETRMSFSAMSGSVSDSLFVPITKEQWNHVAWVWDRSSSENKILGYVNSVLIASSSNQVEMDFVSTNGTNLLIGSGSGVTSLGLGADTTFSGYLDEFRLWHSVRTQTEINDYKQKVIFANDSKLKLYYRFDEPQNIGSNIVIDYSSNSLHGRLSAGGVALGVRDIDKSTYPENPMTYQKLEYSPILFPDSDEVFELQNDFLVDAVAYDKINPNLITRLIPPHYLIEGQEQDGLDSEEGQIVSYTEGGQDPRTAKLGGTQTLLLMLYTWAKFFDEIKLYTQAFSNLDYVDYDETDTVPDEFLQDMASRYGLTLPPLFQGSSIEQFVEAENIDNTISTNSLSLQNVQNQIWRRILINMQDFMKSKGTLHSVKSFIRTIGIDPDSTFRIREYGGPTKQPLTFVRETKTEVASVLNFVSGGLVQSPILRTTTQKTEPGWPYPGNLSITDYTNVFTSGSFSYEGTYKFSPNITTGTSQSLVTLFASSSVTTEGTTTGRKPLLLNVVATKGGNTTLYTRNFFTMSSSSVASALVLPITGADIFDGDTWYVSCGRQRNDNTGITNNLSSSFFLRLAKSINGEIIESHVTQSYYLESNPNSGNNLFEIAETDPGFVGTYLSIGSSSVDNSIYTGSLWIGLNPVTASSIIPVDSRFTNFTGKVGQIRFWSKYLTDSEWVEHVRNFKSVGVQTPSVNFNFNTTSTGSFERLRLDCSTDQLVTQSNSIGQIVLTDFSQNNFALSGSGFPNSYQVIAPERFYFSYLSPKFDEGSTTNKIRIRGFQDYAKVIESPWAESAPVYDIPKSEEPTDNERFSIDFSVVDALNEDIMTIFSTLDELDNLIGNPELMFSSDYPGLEDLREVYFNKLTGQMNIKGFFEFFKWFDTNIGTFVSQLLPRKTKFLGTNFVISSHVLERPKVQYQFEDIYLGDSNRDALKDTILLQLLQGTFDRY